MKRFSQIIAVVVLILGCAFYWMGIHQYPEQGVARSPSCWSYTYGPTCSGKANGFVYLVNPIKG